MSWLVIFSLISFFYISCFAPKEISIIPLDMLNYVDTFTDRGEKIKFKSDFYLVKNYSDNRRNLFLIDSFVEKNKSKGLDTFTQYGIIFFKESSKTNIQSILLNPKVIDRYSNNNDKIFQYNWSKGKFLSKFKIKKGKIVEPKNDIIIEDIKDTIR